MRSIVFELKIVTPLFMGNATFASEIRTQSINGVIRHWFRLLGGDPEKEVKLFGNTFSKGNVFIRINSEKLTPINKQISVNNYVSFPIKKRSYIPTELNGLKSTNFTITFLFHPRLNEEEIKQFLCAFWCSLYLGNFGSRSTRGFGSLICTNQPNFESLVKNFCLSFEINEDTSQWYKQQIDYIKNINKWERVKNLPFVFEDLEIYLLSENFSNYEGAINRMSSLMQKYRKEYNPDYKYVRMLLEKAKNIIFEQIKSNHENKIQVNQIDLDKIELHRVTFGLPLVFTFHDKESNKIYTIQFIQRKPSPIRFKIIQKEQHGKKEIQSLFIVFNPTKSGFKFPFISTDRDINESWNQTRLKCKIKIEKKESEKSKKHEKNQKKEKETERKEFSVEINQININIQGFEIINRFLKNLVDSKQIQKVEIL